MFYSFILLIFIGCAASRYEKAEVLYESRNYRALVESGLDCSEYSTECFKLKFYRTEGFYEMGDFAGTLESAQEAIERISEGIPLNQIIRLYSLKTESSLEKLTTLKKSSEKAALLRAIEFDLREIILLIQSRDGGESHQLELNEFQVLLAESLLRRMDVLSGKNREIIHDRIIQLIREFDQSLTASGYDRLYQFLAEFKLLQPEIDDWIYRGQLKRNREELLNRLKRLYKKALVLRNLPVYQKGESDRIERYIASIDDTMKKLVL